MTAPSALRAEPDPRGGRIALAWVNPASSGFTGVRVLRRESRFPDVPGDLGTPNEVHQDFSTPAGEGAEFVDVGLRPEVVYYYAVVAVDVSGAHAAFASAFPTAPYGTADRMYESLPEVYRLYDTRLAAPGSVAPEDATKGQLRRFIDLLAQPLDLLRSAAATTRTLHDVDRVDVALLPLLAQWIGEPMNDRLAVPAQRNALRFAPHYFRTVGIAANLRAAINRLSAWDAQLKEFVHNVFLTNHPDDLALRESVNQGALWSASSPLNFDVAPSGRASPIAARDGRLFVFYHARVTPPRARQSLALTPSEDEWHLFYKVRDAGDDLASIRLTRGASRWTAPCAVERPDGSLWVFSTLRVGTGASAEGRIGLHVMRAGGPALAAKIEGSATEPFALADGDRMQIERHLGAFTETRSVVARAEHFADIGAATAAEVARLADRELPGLDVSATEDGRIRLVSRDLGASVSIVVPASALATKLGLAAAPVTGRDAFAAEVRGALAEPFALASGDALTLKVDTDEPRVVVFDSEAFANIGAATAAEVAAAINQRALGVARADAGHLVLTSTAPGASSLVAVDAALSSAAAKLGFGAALPLAAGVDEESPAAFDDGTGGVWAFWASRRNTTWNIRYARFDGVAWSQPKALTGGLASSREPCALIDGATGRVWVAFARRKDDGSSNVFVRTTTQLNFAALTDADWQESELLPVPADYDNREPSGLIAAGSQLELFFASNRLNGWNVWTKTLAPGTPLTQGADAAVTSGQETQRFPAPVASAGATRVFFRSNASRPFVSAVYPLTRTFDGRYSGSTSADTRNPAKLSRRGELQDICRYSYDTGRESDDLFARDTIGVYLTPDTADEQLVLREKQFLAGALQRFVPIQCRLVFLIDASERELVYTYDAADASPQRLIGEMAFDSILPEVLPKASDVHSDRADVRFVRTWVSGVPSGNIADLSTLPPDLASRLYSGAFDEKE